MIQTLGIAASSLVQPIAPTSLVATNVLRTATLDWSYPTESLQPITKFVVQYKSGANWINLTIGNNLSPEVRTLVTSTTLVGNTTYWYRLSAWSNTINGIYEYFNSFTTARVPSAPTNFVAARGAAGSKAVTVSWTAADPVPSVTGQTAPITGYQISWGTTTSGTGVGTTTVSNVTSAYGSHTIAGLTLNQTLYFRIACINGMGTGGSAVSNPQLVR